MNCEIMENQVTVKNLIKCNAMARDFILKFENLSIFYGEKLADLGPTSDPEANDGSRRNNPDILVERRVLRRSPKPL